MIMRGILNNKKGDISVTLFVFMVVVLSGFTLFSFIRSNLNSVSKFDDARFMERESFWEEGVRFDLTSAGERALIRSYSELLAKNPFNKAEEAISLDLKNKFSEFFKNDKIVKSHYSESTIGVNGEVLNLYGNFVFNYPFVSSGGSNYLNYWYEFEKDFYLEDYGLYPIKKIKEESTNCLSEKSNELILNCLKSKLPNLVSSLGEKEITFKTKRLYLIDGSLRQISFVFLR